MARKPTFVLIVIVMLALAACAPQAAPTSTPPTSTPEVTPEATAEAAEATPEATAEETPEATPESTAEATAEAGAETTTTTAGSSETTTASTTAWACPEGYAGQTLNVYNWSTYIAPDTVANFEQLCDVTVTYDVFESDDALITRLRQDNPGYDVIFPSNGSLPVLIRDELLLPLDFSKIPNFANINPAYKESVLDPENRYSVPYLMGTIGIGYNRTVVTEPITSWEQFFSYEGKVAWIGDSRNMMAIGLLMSGSDPNSTDPAQIAAARAFLIEHGQNVVVIAQDDGQELLARGEVDMVIEYNGDIFQLGLDCQCDDFVYVVPTEGTGISSGHVAIPKGALNPALAEVFIDYLLDPQVGADIANYTTYPSPNQASIDAGLIDPVLLNNQGIYPDQETLERLYYVLTPADVEQLYNDAWDEVKIALSQ